MPTYDDTPDRPAPREDLQLDRRRFLARLAAAGLTAPFLGAAWANDHDAMDHAAMDHDAMDHDAMDHDGMDHGAMDHGAMAMEGGVGPDRLPAAEIPWERGTCSFCGMTIATPEGGRLDAGFRERTYGQIVLDAEIDGAAVHHFESIACMVNWAYAKGVRDGHGATFYVADEGAATAPEHGLLAARDATFLWAEGLTVSMNARLAAYPNDAAADAGLARLEAPGRHLRMNAATLYDLAPWPEMNLAALLADASGLLGD